MALFKLFFEAEAPVFSPGKTELIRRQIPAGGGDKKGGDLAQVPQSALLIFAYIGIFRCFSYAHRTREPASAQGSQGWLYSRQLPSPALLRAVFCARVWPRGNHVVSLASDQPPAGAGNITDNLF
jgi:hypothetical protein